MSDDQEQKFVYYRKIAWVIYSILAVVIAALLVLFVAQDNEERFFYGLMTVGAAYAFRPSAETFDRLVTKYTGVAPPANAEED